MKSKKQIINNILGKRIFPKRRKPLGFPIIIVVTSLICSFMLCGYSSFIFMAGYHNIDLGHNMRYMESLTNTTLIDDDGKTERSGIELVSLGTDQMLKGYYLLGVACCVFTASLIIIYER